MTKRIISVLLVLVLLAAALPMSAFAATGTVEVTYSKQAGSFPLYYAEWKPFTGAAYYWAGFQYLTPSGAWSGLCGEVKANDDGRAKYSRVIDSYWIACANAAKNPTDSYRTAVNAYTASGTLIAEGHSDVFHTGLPTLETPSFTVTNDGVVTVAPITGESDYNVRYAVGLYDYDRPLDGSIRTETLTPDARTADFSKYLQIGKKYFIKVHATSNGYLAKESGTSDESFTADEGIYLRIKERSHGGENSAELGEKLTVSFTLRDLPYEAASVGDYVKCWIAYADPDLNYTEGTKVKGTSASRDITFSKPGLYAVGYVAQLFDKSGNAIGEPRLLEQVKFNVGYGIWVNGVEFTPDRKKITCGDGYAEIRGDKAPYTVALFKATIDTAYAEGGSAYGIYSPYGGITLSMGGKNSITVTNTNGGAYGIYVKGALKIENSGDLNIAIDAKASSYGIYTTEGMTDKHAGSMTIGALNSDSRYSANAISSPNGTSNKLSGACKTLLQGGSSAGYNIVAPSGKQVRVSELFEGDITAAWNGTTPLVSYKYLFINDDITFYDVIVEGVEVLSTNKSDVLGDGAVSYDPDTKTLTFSRGVELTVKPLPKCVTGSERTENYAIYAKDDLTVVFGGASRITDANASYSDGYGIRSANGSLALKGASADIDPGNTFFGVGAKNDVTIHFFDHLYIFADGYPIDSAGEKVIVKDGTVALKTYDEDYGVTGRKIDLSSYPAARKVEYRELWQNTFHNWTSGNILTDCSDYAWLEIGPLTYNVTLDTTKLVGATVTGVPSKAAQGSGFTITVTVDNNRRFNSNPTIAVTGATAGVIAAPTSTTFTCAVTNVTGPVKVTVSGNADCWYQSVGCNPNCGQVKLIYEGYNGGWGSSIAAYRPNGTKVTLQQKANAGYYFDGWRSGSDTTKVISRESEYSYTVNNSASSLTATYGILNNVKRLYGASRTATAAAISAETYATADSVVLASGDNYADALAGVTFAVAKKAPILLVQKAAGLDKATLDEIARLKAGNVYILGGTAAIPEAVETQLKNSGCTVTRVKGKSRYETAVEVANALETIRSAEPQALFFVCAENYPDALAVSGVAANKQGAILYMNKQGTLDAATEAYLKGLSNKPDIYVIGGTGAVGAPAETNLAKYDKDGSVQRVKGKDRYLTCIEINTTFGGFKGDKVCVATGLSFPDALAGGVLCAEKQMPLILVPKDIRSDTEIKDQYRYFVNNYMNLDLTVYVLGGKAAVSEAIADRFAKTSFYDLRS